VRTGNRFGKNYVIDVLLGKSDQKIRANGHDQLSVFGIINDFSESALSQIANQLAGLEFVKKSDGRYPTLGITKKGIEFLKGAETLMIPRPYIAPETRKIKKGELDYDFGLFEELRALRKSLAEAANVPPFIIFGDTSLQEMAYYLPQDRDAFAMISGVGSKKLETLGNDFLRVIVDYTDKNHLSPKAI